jgi:Predicted integral membrane protein
VRQYHADADPREVGRALGVDAVLTGSLRQDGTHARVNVQLLRAADGTQIWGDNFDRELNEVFAIQSDLALQIASALKATVLPMEASGVRKLPTHVPQAYLLYVQANDFFTDSDKPRHKLETAEQLLRQAVQRDPNFRASPLPCSRKSRRFWVMTISQRLRRVSKKRRSWQSRRCGSNPICPKHTWRWVDISGKARTCW